MHNFKNLTHIVNLQVVEPLNLDITLLKQLILYTYYEINDSDEQFILSD